MVKTNFMLSLVALVVMTMTSCVSVNLGNNDKDSTPSQVQQLNQVTTMQPFDGVDIANAFKVIYDQGTEYSVRIEATEQALKEMTVYVKDRELRIRKSVSKPTVEFKNVKIYVTSPDIQSIELAGSGMFAASNPITASKNLDVDLAGSGKVLLAAVSCHNSHLDIAGSGDIEFGNLKANEVKAEIAGSGNVSLGVLTCKNFIADIAGSGDVNCDNITADNAHADIAGSGSVTLKGTVGSITKDIAGSGKVNVSGLEVKN